VQTSFGCLTTSLTDGNGLYYMRARFYSPEIKRFVNMDVLLGNLSEGQTLNRFGFVMGNPISFIDPSGLVADYVWDILVIAYDVYHGISTGEWTPLSIDLPLAIAPGVPAGFGILGCGAKASKVASKLSFGASGRKLDFLFDRSIDQSKVYNALRAKGNASRIGIADTPANRAEVTRLSTIRPRLLVQANCPEVTCESSFCLALLERDRRLSS
jgi:RHS repeat-associated protein